MARESLVTFAAGLLVAATLVAAIVVAISIVADTAGHLHYSGSNARIGYQVPLRVRSP